MNTYSQDYKHQQELMHQQRQDYGISGHKYADQVLGLAKSLGTRDLLDYGCGKQTLAKSLPFPIQNYDPFIPECSTRPQPADLVVCTDVMEHVEEPYVDDVLADIRDHANKVVFFEIATRPAKKNLPDGRNAHITQHEAAWWMPQLCTYFQPVSFQRFDGFFLFIGEPRK